MPVPQWDSERVSGLEAPAASMVHGNARARNLILSGVPARFS
jgi:hypothetical protein